MKGGRKDRKNTFVKMRENRDGGKEKDEDRESDLYKKKFTISKQSHK